MPRNVRNFWIELTVDGKKTRVATGPRAKDGGFELTIDIRNQGGIGRAMRIIGTAEDDGRLTVTAYATMNASNRRDNYKMIVETRR